MLHPKPAHNNTSTSRPSTQGLGHTDGSGGVFACLLLTNHPTPPLPASSFHLHRIIASLTSTHFTLSPSHTQGTFDHYKQAHAVLFDGFVSKNPKPWTCGVGRERRRRQPRSQLGVRRLREIIISPSSLLTATAWLCLDSCATHTER